MVTISRAEYEQLRQEKAQMESTRVRLEAERIKLEAEHARLEAKLATLEQEQAQVITSLTLQNECVHTASVLQSLWNRFTKA